MTPMRPTRVLLVEDSPSDVLLTRDALEAGGRFRVVSADRLRGAIAQLDEGSFDAVLLDLALPDAQGLEALLALRRRVPDLPVIVMTARDDEELGLRAVQEGAQDYLIKGRADEDSLGRAIDYAIERAYVEDTLRQQKDFVDGLIEAAQAIILVLDPAGGVVRFNRYLEDLSGHSLEDVRGQDWFALMLPEPDRARARAAFLEALDGVAPRPTVTMLAVRASGEREITWTYKALKDGRGRAAGVLAVGNDITELREAQRRSLQAERLAAIGQMLTVLAHESGNALSRSQACLEMLGQKVADRHDAADLVARIQKAQDQLHHLYDDIRGFAAPISLERGPCDLADVWSQAWADLASLHQDRDAEVHHRDSGLDLACLLDPHRMVQVFRNLLENSLAACKDPVRIEIHCDGADIDGRPGVRVAVRDNGPGLGPEQRLRIFEPFFTTKSRGTGLGMAIARRIVEAHGGTIAVGDRADPGAGAEFILTLPRCPS